MEPYFDANYNPTRPVVVLHRPESAVERPHTICRPCYDRLQQNDDRCPECRAEIDGDFVNNPAAQNRILTDRRGYLAAQKNPRNSGAAQAARQQEQERVRREAEENVRRQRRAQEQQQAGNGNPAPDVINRHIRYVSVALCLLPGFWRWYINQLARIF